MPHLRRFLALLLLAVSPGLGGAALQAVHSCASRDAVAAAQDADIHHGGHHGGDHGAPDDEGGCRCIGDCQATPFAAPFAVPVVAFAAVPPFAALPVAAGPRVAPSLGAFRLLPPATAPPRA